MLSYIIIPLIIRIIIVLGNAYFRFSNFCFRFPLISTFTAVSTVPFTNPKLIENRKYKDI